MQAYKPGDFFVVKDATRNYWKFIILKDSYQLPDDDYIFHISVSSWETEKEKPFLSLSIVSHTDSITRADIFSAFMARMSEIALALVS
jgi:hypothetical protein